MELPTLPLLPPHVVLLKEEPTEGTLRPQGSLSSITKLYCLLARFNTNTFTSSCALQLGGGAVHCPLNTDRSHQRKHHFLTQGIHVEKFGSPLPSPTTHSEFAA